MDYTKELVIDYYKRKYAYMDEEHIEIMYDCAYDIMLNLRYPTQENIYEIPESFMKKHKTWIFRCIQEHIDKEGMGNAISYSENGVSITFDKSGISRDLILEITPLAKIGVVSL